MEKLDKCIFNQIKEVDLIQESFPLPPCEDAQLQAIFSFTVGFMAGAVAPITGHHLLFRP
jgi:hypothetical protein